MKIKSKIANIDTLTVSIKSIRISKKQMTLAVFRQIPMINIFTEKGNIITDFTYWGIVRYAIRDRGDLWVVLSDDGILYKACINWYFEDDWRLDNQKKALQEAQGKLDLYHKNRDLIEVIKKRDHTYYENMSKLPKELRHPLHFNEPVSMESIHKEIESYENHIAYQTAIRSSKIELSKLDQLFIAV